MRGVLVLLLVFALVPASRGQEGRCVLKSPQVTIHFGSGRIGSTHSMIPDHYRRIETDCPSDGYFMFAPSTFECFRNDWFSLTEDHTPGDAKGNMLIINSSYYGGIFFRTFVDGLKPGKHYEFAAWMMNMCKITKKCPYPLLPDISVQLRTRDGKSFAQYSLGEVQRVTSPRWTQHKFMFVVPASQSSIEIVMTNQSPGGCGNDFAMDDITFRECVPIPPTTLNNATPPAKRVGSSTSPSVRKAVTSGKPAAKTGATNKPTVKRSVTHQPAAKTSAGKITPTGRQSVASREDSTARSLPQAEQRLRLPPAPVALTSRTNVTIRRIETDARDITIDLYDNGEIDGDTVTIYHNNSLVVKQARISEKPVRLTIPVNREQPHHEIVMVADNLGAIPPNTSLMVVTAGSKRYEVFISTTRQKNAKVVVDLAE